MGAICMGTCWIVCSGAVCLNSVHRSILEDCFWKTVRVMFFDTALDLVISHFRNFCKLTRAISCFLVLDANLAQLMCVPIRNVTRIWICFHSFDTRKHILIMADYCLERHVWRQDVMKHRHNLPFDVFFHH